MTYFISIDEIKQNNVINANVDSEYIEPALREAQNIFLREILGDALYNAIENRINGNNLTGKYATLVNQYIKPYLENRMLASLVVPISMKIRNAGVIQQFDQGFNSSNVKDVNYLADYYNGRVEFYGNRMTAYLSKNINDIPEWRYSDQNITNPTVSQNVSTIYLGGGRKRPCGANYGGSGGGSTDTVDWNDIQNKPDFAEVATSGDYDDLDNKPEIPSLEGYATEEWVQEQGYSTFDGDYNSLTNKPTIPTVPTNVSAFANDAGYLTQHQSLDGYATEQWVSEQGFSTFSGSYEDLTDKPSIPTVNDALLTIKQGGVTKGTFSANSNQNIEIDLEAGGSGSTDWSDIQNKPNFANVATSGSYNDLSNRPDMDEYVDAETFNARMTSISNQLDDKVDEGTYNQGMNDVDTALENRVTYGEYTPKMAAIDNTLADKVDTTALCTINNERLDTRGNFELVRTDSIATLTIKQGGTTKGTFTPNSGTDVEINLESGGSGSTDWNDITNKPNFANVATSGSYNDLSDKPTIPTKTSELTNDSGFTTFDGDYNSLTNKPTIPAAQVQSDWNQTNTSEVDYIKNKPTIPVVPTNVSAFANDAGYLTQHQSLAGYATENWVQQQGYSTFSGSYNDLSDKPTIPAAQVNSDWNASTGVAQILNKPTIPTKTSELTNDSGYSTFSGSYNDLSDKPTIPAAQVQSDWNANSGMGQILNKPSMTAETWEFTLSDNTTVTKTVWLQ